MVNEEVVLSVYFCGTDSRLNDATTQIGLFEELTQAQSLSDKSTEIDLNQTQFKMGFDGCGEAFGFRGAIFAHGLEIQCAEVVARVNELFNLGKKVKLNLLGLSRGGIAELFLIQKLKDIDRMHLQINALIFDPVPGNLITSRKLDFLRQTTANKAMNVSDSKNLNDVVAIYPVEPLKDLQFHAPLIPKYPSHTSVKNIVIPGCHQGALMTHTVVSHNVQNMSSSKLGSRMSHFYIYHFLQNHGTVLGDSPMLVDEEKMLSYMENFTPAQSTRTTHNRHGISGLRIQSSNKDRAYMSREHYRLQNNVSENDPEPEDLVFKMHFKPDLPWKQKTNTPVPDKQMLSQFAHALKNAVSQRSQMKSQHLQKIIDYIEQQAVLSLEQTNIILRDILALALQRERNPMHLWTCSRTGLKALSLLKTPEYHSLKLLVQPRKKQIHYHDLREFIIGSNTSKYFTENHRDRNYFTLDIMTRYQDKDKVVNDSYAAVRALR